MVDTPDRVIVLKIVSENGPFAEVVEAIAKTKAEMEKVNAAADKMQKKFDAAKKGVDNIKHSFDNVFSIISKVSGVFASGFSVAESANEVISYARQLTALSSQFSKYGVGITDLEKRIVSFGKEISLTRAETMKLFAVFEKRLPFTSLGAAEDILRNIKKAVGADEAAIASMGSSVLDLINMYPSLEKSVRTMGAEDKKRLSSVINMAQASGKLTREQAKGMMDYITMNKQISDEDKEALRLRQEQIETQQKVKKLYEDLSITIGEKLYPMIKGAFDYIDKHKETIMKIGELFGKWVIPLTIAKSLVGGIFHTALGGAKILPEMATGMFGGQKSGGLTWMGGGGGRVATEAIQNKISKNMLTGAGARVFVTNFPLSMMAGKGEAMRQTSLASTSGAIGAAAAGTAATGGARGGFWTKSRTGRGGETFGGAGVAGTALAGAAGHEIGKAGSEYLIESTSLKDATKGTKEAISTAGAAFGAFTATFAATGNPFIAIIAAGTSAIASSIGNFVTDMAELDKRNKEINKGGKETVEKNRNKIREDVASGVKTAKMGELENRRLNILNNLGDAIEKRDTEEQQDQNNLLSSINQEIAKQKQRETKTIGGTYLKRPTAEMEDAQKKEAEDKIKRNKNEEISLQNVLLKATQEQKQAELSFLDAQIGKLSTIGGSYAEQASVLDKIEAATSTINAENDLMSKLRMNALEVLKGETSEMDKIRQKDINNKKTLKEKTKELQEQSLITIKLANSQILAPEKEREKIGEKIKEEIEKESKIKKEINDLENDGVSIAREANLLQDKYKAAKSDVAKFDTAILQNQQKIREFLNEQLKLTKAIVEANKGLTDASFSQLQAEIELYKGRGDMKGLSERMNVLGAEAYKNLQEQIRSQKVLSKEYDVVLMKIDALDKAQNTGTEEDKKKALDDMIKKYTELYEAMGKKPEEAAKLAHDKALLKVDQQRKDFAKERANTDADAAKSALKVKDLAVAYIETESENLKLAEQQANILGQQVSLMDNYAVGIKASAAARMEQLEAVRKQMGFEDRMIKKNQEKLADKNLTENVRVHLEQELNKHVSNRISLMQKEAEIGKSMRDAWIGAIGAMTVGTGRITKITMDQSKNTGLIAENISGAVRSYKGGAVGRAGERVGHNVSSRATGEFGQFTGPAGQGFEPYEVYGGMHYANLQNAMRGNAQGFYGEWAQKNKLATAGGMAGQAAGGHPTYMGALINGQRKTGGVSTFGYGGSPGATINEAMNGSRGGTPGATPTNEPVKIDVNITSQLGKEFETIVAPGIRRIMEEYVGPLADFVMSVM